MTVPSAPTSGMTWLLVHRGVEERKLRPYIGGAIIAVGVALLVAAALYKWFARARIFSGPNYATARSEADRRALDARGQRIADRMASLSRRAVWPGAAIIVVGIIVAVV
jgi:hypothetical protein